MVMLLASVMITSCQSDDGSAEKQDGEFAGFAKAYNLTVPNVFSIGVDKFGASGGPQKSMGSTPDSMKTVYIKPGDGFNPGDEFALGDIFIGNNVMELVEFADGINGTIMMFNDGTAIDSVSVSEREARETLEPMVQEAWEYLRGKGMTDDEINAMLEENNVNESALVPLMIALMDYEDEFYKGVVTCAPPAMGGNQATQDRKFDFNKAGSCALKVLGVDIIDALKSSGAKRLTKTVIFNAFKAVAKRFTGGYLGVAIAVVEWGLCMGEA